MCWARMAEWISVLTPFCVLHQLYAALRRRDVFVSPSWRYGDPRAGLLSGSDWEATRPIIWRTLTHARPGGCAGRSGQRVGPDLSRRCVAIAE